MWSHLMVITTMKRNEEIVDILSGEDNPIRKEI